MSNEAERLCALEQALYAVMSAAEQYGVAAEDLRLMAVSGLSLNPRWTWVDEDSVGGAEIELLNAVNHIGKKNLRSGK